jgi:hypothetical protein
MVDTKFPAEAAQKTLPIHRTNNSRSTKADVGPAETKREVRTSATNSTAQARIADPSPGPAGAAKLTHCPRCGDKLSTQTELAWCVRCGYCRALETAASRATLVAPPPSLVSSGGLAEVYHQVSSLPRWFWVLFQGVAAIAVFSALANFFLPANSLPRAVWSTVQLGSGLIGLLGAQIWSLALLARYNDQLSGKNILFAGPLWKVAWERLPETRKQVWLGAWSAAAALCAVFVVGGLTYWCQFYKPPKVRRTNVLGMAAKVAKNMKSDRHQADLDELLDGEGEGRRGRKADLTVKKTPGRGKGAVNQGSLTDAVKDLAATQEVPDVSGRKRDAVRCAILGFMLEEDKEITGLVLATLENDELRYAGVVEKGLTLEVNPTLLRRLKPLITNEPALPGLDNSATWVEPEAFCEVYHSGMDGNHLLKEPSFKRLLAAEATPDRPTERCVIAGYILQKQEVSGLVLATVHGTKLNYVGVVERGFTPEVSRELLRQLTPLVRSAPVFPDLAIDATWVRPKVYCDIFHSGYDQEQLLKDPHFKELVKETPKRGPAK